MRLYVLVSWGITVLMLFLIGVSPLGSVFNKLFGVFFWILGGRQLAARKITEADDPSVEKLRYSAGQALLSKDNLRELLKRISEPFFVPGTKRRSRWSG